MAITGYGKGELWFRIRDFWRYNRLERRDLLLSVFVVAFAFAYDDGREIFNLALWAGNFIFVLFAVFVTFIVHTGFQKVFALQQGYIAEYKAWPLGLAITFIVSIIAGGKWYFLLAGGIHIIHVPILRIGRWRYGVNVTAQGMIGASGAIANLVFATICLFFGAQLGILPGIFLTIAKINFWVLIFSMLPIPRLDGIHLFHMSRLVYIFIFCTLLAYVIMAVLGFYSWIISLLIGGLCWLLFLLFVEM